MTGTNVGNLFKQNSIDVQSVDTNDSALDVDAATDVAAKFFNDLPLRASFARAAHIEAQADMAMRLEGAENFTNAAMVRMQPGRGVDDEENDDNASVGKAIVRSALDQMTRDQERQREEHLRSTSTFAGVAMTGAEWKGLSDALSQDSPLRRWLMERMKRDGKTEREAEELTRQMGRTAAIMAKPESESTAEDRAFLDRVEQDPEIQHYLAEVDMKQRGLDPRAADLTESVMAGSTDISVDSRSAAFESFPTAPDATAHYRAALTSTAPLDAPRVPNAPAIERPASAPTIDSGFAV